MAQDATYPASSRLPLALVETIDLTANEVVEEFSVSVMVAKAQTVLHLRGEVDFLSSPYMRGVLEAAIDAGHSDVVLDLTDLEFMDGSGLRVIASAADRLEMLGGALAIRSPSALILRMLKITGMAELTVPDPRDPAGLS